MLRSIIRILRASLVQIDTEIAEKCAKPQQRAVCGKFTFGRHGTGSVSALMGLVSLTFDLLILKLVCKSHLRWGTFIPNLGTLGLQVLELFAMYAMDRWTDGRTDRQKQHLGGA